MAYVYTFGLTDTDYTANTSSGWAPHQFNYGGRITIAEAGTIDTLGVRGFDAATSPVAIKIALFDTSGNLIAGTSTTLSMTDTAGWFDSAAFTPVAVSAQDYMILYSAEDADASYYYNNTGGNDGTTGTDDYADFPTDPLTGFSAEAEADIGYSGRANFTAGTTRTPSVGSMTATGAAPTVSVSSGPAGTNTIIIVPTGPALS